MGIGKAMEMRKYRYTWLGRKWSALQDIYYSVVIGVCNIIFFLPSVWRYRAWSEQSLYLMWAKAAEKNRVDILKYSYYRDSDKSVASLKRLESVLKRLASDDDIYWYCQEYKTEDRGWRFTYNHPLSPKRTPEAGIEQGIHWSKMRRKQDCEYLCKLIYKHGENWSY